MEDLNKQIALLNVKLLEKDFEIQNLKSELEHLHHAYDSGLDEYKEMALELESLKDIVKALKRNTRNYKAFIEQSNLCAEFIFFVMANSINTTGAE